jgi:hypothetical protein
MFRLMQEWSMWVFLSLVVATCGCGAGLRMEPIAGQTKMLSLSADDVGVDGQLVSTKDGAILAGGSANLHPAAIGGAVLGLVGSITTTTTSMPGTVLKAVRGK